MSAPARAALIVLLALPAMACAGAQRVRTAHYELDVPDFWEVRAVAAGDGQPTLLGIGQYGDAVIDEGAGSVAPSGVNYDVRTAEVEARLYTWPGVSGPGPAEDEAYARLADEAELALPAHLRVPELPFECNRFARKFRFQGQALQPIDLLKRPGWRTILVGAYLPGALLGVLVRVEFEPDIRRYCHNLNNLQLQLQTLLDNLRPASGPPGPAGAR